jgi:hypothetical protein
MKACPNAHILSIFRDMGLHIDASRFFFIMSIELFMLFHFIFIYYYVIFLIFIKF